MLFCPKKSHNKRRLCGCPFRNAPFSGGSGAFFTLIKKAKNVTPGFLPSTSKKPTVICCFSSLSFPHGLTGFPGEIFLLCAYAEPADIWWFCPINIRFRGNDPDPPLIIKNMNSPVYGLSWNIRKRWKRWSFFSAGKSYDDKHAKKNNEKVFMSFGEPNRILFLFPGTNM